MTKKVALVDIDGCLLQDGKLNPMLVKKLQDYDEVILFTQRSKFIQILQAKTWRGDIITDIIKPTDILITPDAVEQLSKALNKDIKVSTSVDQFFGEPCSYYENELKGFELQLKKELYEDPEALDLNKFDKLCNESEVPNVRKFSQTQPNQEARDFYPKGKVEQYITLVNALPRLLKTRKEMTVDLFDDSDDNLREIMDNRALPIKPKCFLVQGPHMCNFLDFEKKVTPKTINRKLVIAIEIENTITDLKNYKANLINPSTLFKVGSFFNHRSIINEQINTIDKAIQILTDPEVTVDLTNKDLQTLQRKPLNTLLNGTSPIIEQYATKNSQQLVAN